MDEALSSSILKTRPHQTPDFSPGSGHRFFDSTLNKQERIIADLYILNYHSKQLVHAAASEVYNLGAGINGYIETLDVVKSLGEHLFDNQKTYDAILHGAIVNALVTPEIQKEMIREVETYTEQLGTLPHRIESIGDNSTIREYLQLFDTLHRREQYSWKDLNESHNKLSQQIGISAQRKNQIFTDAETAIITTRTHLY